jgi:DNA polymerase III gamma/tau subunit
MAFLVATTEADRLPATIKSRCISLQLKRIPAELIANELKKICENEKILYEDEAIKLISENAEGSMRDAISLLESVGDLTLGRTEKALCTTSYNTYMEMLKFLFKGDTKEALTLYDTMYHNGISNMSLVNGILNCCTKLLINQKVKNTGNIVHIIDVFNNIQGNNYSSIISAIYTSVTYTSQKTETTVTPKSTEKKSVSDIKDNPDGIEKVNMVNNKKPAEDIKTKLIKESKGYGILHLILSNKETKVIEKEKGKVVINHKLDTLRYSHLYLVEILFQKGYEAEFCCL